MFENLVESKPTRERTLGETALSVTCHAMLALGAIQATRGAAAVAEEKITDRTDFVLHEPPPPPAPPSDEPNRHVNVVVDASPKGFQTVRPPTDLRIEIPPANLKETFDARAFSGLGAENGVVDGVVGAPPSLLTNLVGTESFTIDQVDDPVRLIGGPEPVYPDAMKIAGIEGVVRLRFVVGVDGKVESSTVRVVSSSHEAFERSAIEGIRTMRFKSATMRGQTVRQLVEQNVRFRLD